MRVLEAELQGNDERIVDLAQDGPFSEGMCDFGSRDDVGFSDGFHGVNSARVLLPDLHHLAERAFANYLQELERFDGQLGVLRRLEHHLKMEAAGSVSCVGLIPSIDDRLAVENKRLSPPS